MRVRKAAEQGRERHTTVSTQHAVGYARCPSSRDVSRRVDKIILWTEQLPSALTVTMSR
jgi:hypothetical protein